MEMEKIALVDGLVEPVDIALSVVDSYVNAYLGSKYFSSQLENYKVSVKLLGPGLFKGSRFSVSVSERKQADVVDIDWKRICEIFCENAGFTFKPSDELVSTYTKRTTRPNVLAVLPPVPLCTPGMIVSDV